MFYSGMRISYAPTFTSNQRVVTYGKPELSKEEPVIKHRNTTCFFRSDMNWDELPTYLDKKYAQVQRINTYCYACSDGSEPYSFVMKMISKLGEDKAEKFFPVQAKDYDEFIIGQAQSRRAKLVSYEPQVINQQTNGALDNYMEYLGKRRIPSYEEHIYAVKDNLFNKVNFAQANVLSDVKQIPSDNTVVFCRNFWPYLRDGEKINNLAKNLYNQLGQNSCVILGEYDQGDERVFVAMRNAGFKLVDENMRIFEKIQQNVQSKKGMLAFVRKLFL